MAYVTAGSARITGSIRMAALLSTMSAKAICGCSRRYPPFHSRSRRMVPIFVGFNDGNFDEFETFLLTDWMHHSPRRCWQRTSMWRPSTFRNVPAESCLYSHAICRRPLAEDRNKSMKAGACAEYLRILRQQDAADRGNRRRSVKIIDRSNFPATDIAAAIVTVKPGGLRDSTGIRTRMNGSTS